MFCTLVLLCTVYFITNIFSVFYFYFVHYFFIVFDVTSNRTFYIYTYVYVCKDSVLVHLKQMF